MQVKAIVFILLFLGAGCSGYRLRQNENPLAIYNIKSLAIPMFLNRSVIPNVSSPIHREIYHLMSSYSGLKIYAGGDKDADAVLLGIVESDQYRHETFQTETRKFTTGDLEESIGGRSQFYVPAVTRYNVAVRLILIRRPTSKDLKILNSELAPYIKNHPRVIFNEVIEKTPQFSRIVSPNNSPDDGGAVNFTQNKAQLEQSIQAVAKDVANDFKEVVLNAF